MIRVVWLMGTDLKIRTAFMLEKLVAHIACKILNDQSLLRCRLLVKIKKKGTTASLLPCF